MTRLGLLCDRVLEVGWLAALVTVPLYFNIYSSRVFEPDKITMLRAIVAVMCAAYVVKVLEAIRDDAEIRWPGGLKFGALIQAAHSKNPLALPALALAAAYLLSTVVSVTPATSFWGSYQRLQGTYSMLTYITLFFLVAHNLRSLAQVDRFLKVALLTSVPISLYGVAQYLRLDPLPWGGDVTFRVTSSMGNAIFLAAFLIIVAPLTLGRLVEAASRLHNWDKSRGGPRFDGLRILGLTALLFFQNAFLAFFLKSALGPNLWLGTLPAIGVILASSLAFGAPRRSYFSVLVETIAYGLLLLLQLGAIFLTQSRGPWIGLGVGMIVFAVLLSIRRRARRVLLATSTLTGILVAFILLMSFPNTPLAPLRSMPYVGRMGELFVTESGTGKVRVLIWEGALKLVTDHPSIGFSPDPINFLRPLVGYGPEAMYVAYNKVYPPDLAHYEARNASPDRSHMDLLDHLVMTGALGLIAYLVVIGAAGLSVWHAVRRSNSLAQQVLLVSIIAAIVAHFLETQVGIAIAATMTYLWALLGLSMAVRHLNIANEARVSSGATLAAVEVASSKPVDASIRQNGIGAKRRQQKKNRTRSPAPSKAAALPAISLPSPRLAFAASYGFMTVVGIFFLARSTAPLDIWLAFVVGFAWLLVGIVMVALSLGAMPKAITWRKRNWWLYAPLGLATIVVILLNLNAVVADIFYKRGFSLDMQRQFDQAIPAYQQAISLAPDQDFYYLFLGRSLLELAKTNPRPKANPPIVVTTDLVKQISPQILSRAGKDDMLELSRAALEEALVLSPLNTDHYANLARLYRYWAETGDRQKLDLAIQYYEKALSLSPQAAHLLAEWAEVYLAKGMPSDALEKAKRGIELDPIFAINYVYLGDAYLALGRNQEALDAHLRVVELDPTVLSDPRLENRLAVYLQSGAGDRLVDAYAKAAASERGRNQATVHSVYGYLLSRQGKIKEASQEFRIWATLAPQDWIAHRNLALSYDALGMIDEAITEANEVKKLAPADQQPNLQQWINDLQLRKKS